jgi:predicted outer membrane repeat protein
MRPLPNGTATFEAAGRVLIEDNWAAGDGGGIYASGDHFVNFSFDGITNRPAIAGNSASNRGGGIFMSGGIFTLNNADIGTAAKGNQTRIRYAAGGGAYVCGGATRVAQNAVFAGNTCDDAGAGLAVVEAGALIGAQFTAANRSLLPLSQFVGNISTGQSAAFGGGGLFVSEGVAYVEDTLFAGNAAHRGGGVYGGLSSFVALQNCVIASNKGLLADSVGSGMRLFSATSLVTHCTVAFNANGGIEPNEFSALRMTNSIVYNNTRTNVSAGHTITYSDIGGGYPGTGNIDANPRFYDSTNLDFRCCTAPPAPMPEPSCWSITIVSTKSAHCTGATI